MNTVLIVSARGPLTSCSESSNSGKYKQLFTEGLLLHWVTVLSSLCLQEWAVQTVLIQESTKRWKPLHLKDMQMNTIKMDLYKYI